MRRSSNFYVFALLAALAVAAPTPDASAQTVIAADRTIDWSQAGVSGGIPNRTTVCQTLSPGATAAQINAAISNCPAGQVVMLNAGTYNLSSSLLIRNKSNVTLRGAGPDATFLVFTGSVGCMLGSSDVCVYVDTLNPDNPQYTANWTGGYAKGTSSITLSSTAGLSVGSLLTVDQLKDPLADNGGIWQCQDYPACATEGGSGLSRANRPQGQQVVVTSINGSTVGISPALYMPNWRSGQSPGAWWVSTTIAGVGIEDLSIDNANTPPTFNISFYGVRDSWMRNVRSLHADRAHVLGYVSARITVRDSYFYGTQNAQSQSYGSETDMSSAWLFENNIFEHITGPMPVGKQASGSVYAHNYAIDDYYTNQSWMQASSYHHAAGINYILFEGNDGIGFTADAIHGTSHFMTAFRNYWTGWEPGKTAQTNAANVYAFNRYFNFVGNVLGQPGYHTTYECYASSASASGCTAGVNKSIFMLNWSGNQARDASVPNDPLVRTTMMRWGNYDVVSGVRFTSSEVPSGLGAYANPVPANNTLPDSLYLAARPAGWGSRPFPASGPDVTGGPLMGGRVHKIPARVCYESTAKSGGILNFNARNCYATTARPPAAPSGVAVR